MTTQQTSTNINEIRASCSPCQWRWVLARIHSKTDKEAAILAKVDPATVCRWPNKAQLDEAVKQLLSDDAEAARQILASSASDAALALRNSLHDRHQRVQAANSILDRVGIAPESKVQAEGEVIFRVVYGGDRENSEPTRPASDPGAG